MIDGAYVDDFYLTLPSNSSLQYYGYQHPSHYTTRLEGGVSVDPEQWSLGLASISYPKSWHNVERATFRICLPPKAGRNDVLSASIEGKLYVSGDHLVRELLAVIKRRLPDEHSGKIRIRYDSVANRARVIAEKGYYLWLPKSLTTPLGFAPQDGMVLTADVGTDLVDGIAVPGEHVPKPFDVVRYDDEGEHDTAEEGLYTVNPDRVIPRIYVYCDLAERQLVGDSHVPLLRILDVPCNIAGDMVTHEFTNIHYVDLQRGTFEAVVVKLTDSRGNGIAFNHGDVVIKVHFKKKRT